MKKLLIVFLSCSFMTQAFAQDSQTSQASLSTNDFQTNSNNIVVGAGTHRLNYDYSNGDDESFSGVSVFGGFDFNLPIELKTMTKIAFNSAQNENTQSDFETRTLYRELSATQNISYSIERMGMAFKPFLEVGVALGDYEQATDGFTSEQVQSQGFVSIDTEATYMSSIVALGMQFVLKNSLVPYIRYDFVRTEFSDEESKINTTGSKDYITVDTTLDTITSQALNAGLMYLF